jgi:hypothetical protein
MGNSRSSVDHALRLTTTLSLVITARAVTLLNIHMCLAWPPFASPSDVIYGWSVRDTLLDCYKECKKECILTFLSTRNNAREVGGSAGLKTE